jgi:hypothetical protein
VEMGTALLRGTDVLIAASFGAPASTTLPQVWHSPQRPTHRGVVQPHSVQLWDGLAVLAMDRTLRAGTDNRSHVRFVSARAAPPESGVNAHP